MRLGSVVNVKSSKRIYASDYQNQGIPFFRSKEIGDLSRKEEIKTILFISNQKYTQIKKEFGVPVRGDLLLTSVGSIGNSWISDGREFYYKDGNITQIDKNDLLNVDYLQKYISSPLFIRLVGGTVSGTAYNALTIIKINNLIFPLPPLKEQKRIVEKVNSLMALLDELEEKRERRNQKRIKLNDASLEKLLTSKDDKEQKSNWKRIEENFSTLYSVPENVEKLKQAILQLAVQGKLVKQDPKDEPASELLKKIITSKIKFVKDNKIRTPQKKLINSLLSELVVPSSWEIVRLDDIINFITDFQANGSFASLRENVKYYSNEDYAVLVRLKDLRHDLKKNTDFVYTDKHGYEFLIKSSLIGGEILVANVGAGVGTTLVMPVINRKATLAPNMFKVILNDFIDKNYFLYFANSPLYWDWLNSFMKATAQPKMNKSEYASIIFPLPPLNEQKRIVEKVNELMSMCNTLEEKLTKKETTAEKLVGAVVNAVTKKSNKTKDDKEVNDSIHH